MSKDFIYISIPRTATNSIHKALNTNYLDNHKSLKVIERPGYSFCFTRNPLDLVVSWFYHHRQRQSYIDIYQQPFLKWISQGCPHHWDKGMIEASGITHPLNQHEYISDENGIICVDFIGTFENLNNDFKTVCKTLELGEINLPYLNNSKHQNWESYYTPKAMETVKEIFAIDFALFNYQ